MVSHPGVANPGAMAPVAVSEDFAKILKDYNDSTHTLDLYSTYHSQSNPENLQAGQWTTFLKELNNVPAIRDLITNGNPDPISIGDKIWLQPGTKDSLYTDMGVFEGKTVLLPVVSGVIREGTHDYVTVTGFIGFHITNIPSNHGPNNVKTIIGYFVDGFVAGNTGGSGPNYGAVTPPHLVQ